MYGTKRHNNYNKIELERKWTFTNQKCHKLLVLLVQNLYGLSLSLKSLSDVPLILLIISNMAENICVNWSSTKLDTDDSTTIN